MIYSLALSLQILVGSPTTVHEFESQGMQIVVELIKEGLDIPWGMSFVSGDEMLFTQKRGGAKRLNVRTGELTDIQGAPSNVYFGGQGAFFEINPHPDFSQNSWVYLSYSIEDSGRRTTRMSRAKLKDNQLTDYQVLFTAEPYRASSQHFGGRIAFDAQGYVYLSIGDRGQRDQAQDLSTHNGSIIRLHEDGRVPEDNPFVGREGARPEIWTYGHRNPQGLKFDFEESLLWSHEHGPRGGDEINLIEKGKNYGWPVITTGKEYWGPVSIGVGTEKEGMEQPVHEYTPSIAPCGYSIYRSDHFEAWKGWHILGALALRHINLVKIEERKFVSEHRILESLRERIREIEVAPSGEIYFSTDTGKILRMRRK